MKTISAEQFRKMYGAQAVGQFAQQQTQKPGMLSQEGGGYFGVTNKIGDYAADTITEQFKGGVDQAKQGYEKAKNAKNVGDLFGGSLNLLGGTIAAVTSPITAPLFGKPTSKAIEFIDKNNPINNNPSYQKFATSPAGEATSSGVEALANLNTTAGTIAGFKGGVPKVNEMTSNLKTGVTDIAARGRTAVTDTVSNVKNKVPGMKPTTPADIESSAIRDATPNYETSTPTQKGKLLGRVEEGGVLKGRSVKSNELEIEAGKELSKVPGYDPKATKLSKYQVTKEEIAKRGQALESSLENEKVVVPKREVTSRVQKAVNELPNKSLLLQTSDPVIINYMRVFKNAFKDLPGTLKGVLKLRKTLDDAYENARGKQAFGSDKISALDDVNKVVRDTLYNYLIEKAQNTDVKAGMRSQWNLYRALDELKTAAEKESGSIIGRFKQNNPLINKTAEMGVKAAGFGAGIGIIK